MGVRLKREDWGLAIGAVLAVALIGGFLVATGGSPEDADAGPTTTTEPPRPASGPVRVESDADRGRDWSTARATFRPSCEDGRARHLDVAVSRLPADRRYGWRVVTDPATRATAPLTSRPGVVPVLQRGDGLASAFRPTAAGAAAFRFRFNVPRPDVVVRLGLTVLGVPAQRAFVLLAPRLTCRGTAGEA